MKRGCSAICPEGMIHHQLSKNTSSSTYHKALLLLEKAAGALARVPIHTNILILYRLGLADTEGLYKKIESLRKRVTELEDALRSLQAAVTDEPHPLLYDDADQMNASADRSGNIPDGPLLSAEEEEVLDAFGMLTLPLHYADFAYS